MNMNKKIIIGAILASFIMIGVSMVTAVSTQTKEEKLNKIDSPLFKIRTKNSINEKTESVKTSFLKERVTILSRIFTKLFGSDTDDDSNVLFWTLKGDPKNCFTLNGQIHSVCNRPCGDDSENEVENSEDLETGLVFWCTNNPYCKTMKGDPSNCD